MKESGKVSKTLDAIAARLGDRSIDSLYRDRVRSQRTRSYALNAPKRTSSIDIQKTLLGIELKIGRKRLLCPDLATARFLAVFAGLGVGEVAVPYDITQVKRLAETLEEAREEWRAVFEGETAGMTPQIKGRIRAAWLERQRAAIAQSGAGPIMPEFDQSTRQRRRK